MQWYAIGPTLTPLERAPAAETPGVVLLTSQELSQLSALPGLEETLRHTPAARDVRVCKAEVRPDVPQIRQGRRPAGLRLAAGPKPGGAGG